MFLLLWMLKLVVLLNIFMKKILFFFQDFLKVGWIESLKVRLKTFFLYVIIIISAGPTRRDNRKSRYIGKQNPTVDQHSRGKTYWIFHKSFSSSVLEIVFICSYGLWFQNLRSLLVEEEEPKGSMPVGALCSASSPVWTSPPFPDSRDLAAVNTRARSTLICTSWMFLIRAWLGEMTGRLIQAIISFRRNLVWGFPRIVFVWITIISSVFQRKYSLCFLSDCIADVQKRTSLFQVQGDPNPNPNPDHASHSAEDSMLMMLRTQMSSVFKQMIS